MSDVVPVKPFLKWAGGKYREGPKLLAHFPPLKGRGYVEPFLGAGGMLCRVLNLPPEERPAFIQASDILPELIHAWLTVAYHPASLCRELGYLAEAHLEAPEAFYREVRERFNRSSLTTTGLASDFIYLNKACFNGLFRRNKKGEFNTPFGKHEAVTFLSEEAFGRLACRLEDTQACFAYGDFEPPIDRAGRGDFIYCDPPYAPVSISKVEYTGRVFDQERLCSALERASARGVLWALSNSDVPAIRELYRAHRFVEMRVPRHINCHGKGRGAVGELLIMNY